jgi:hypothetical protein
VGAHWEHIAVLVVRDRSEQTADFRLEGIDAPHLTAVLRPFVDKDAILCTDGGAGSIKRWPVIWVLSIAPSMSCKASPSLMGRSLFKMSTLMTVLKQWMGRFHGVTTKYLESYFGWRRMLERYRQCISPIACLREALGRTHRNS